MLLQLFDALFYKQYLYYNQKGKILNLVYIFLDYQKVNIQIHKKVVIHFQINLYI